MKEKAGVMKPPMTPNTKPSIYMYVLMGRNEERSHINNMYMYIHVYLRLFGVLYEGYFWFLFLWL